ncbi:MAG: alcohol dehydrogenase catalytic domain-containing protein [Solirubrobacterales bacterium]
MRAALMTAHGGPLAIEEVAEPVAAPDGAVVEVKATGVCRSDWHAWQGHDQIEMPHVGGHECAGVVVEVGPEVRGFRPGDRVTLPFCGGCGRCACCVAGETQLCLDGFYPGFATWGSFAERLSVPRADLNLVHLADDLPFEAAAALGCRFMTAWAGVHQHGEVAAGDWVVVHGCGGVGQAATMIAAAAGAGVIAVDVDPAKLETATRLGAAAAVRAGSGTVVEEIREISGGGAHVSIDAIGSPAVIAASLASLRRRGVHVQIGLLYGADATPPIPMDRVYNRELRIVGTMGMSVRHYPGLLRAISLGAIDPRLLVTKRIGLEDIGAELDLMTAFGQTGVTIARL